VLARFRFRFSFSFSLSFFFPLGKKMASRARKDSETVAVRSADSSARIVPADYADVEKVCKGWGGKFFSKPARKHSTHRKRNTTDTPTASGKGGI
jgi:hypothetical protein